MGATGDSGSDGGGSFRDEFSSKYREEGSKIGAFNLAVFGLTGVGKSTLINSIFGRGVAATGTGQPVTQGSHLYVHDSGLFGVFDTAGVELGQSYDTVLGDVRAFVEAQRSHPLSDQIHVAYYCVRSTNFRMQEFEEQFVRELHSMGLPVILVLTQVPKKGEQYHPKVLELAQHIYQLGLPIYLGRPLLTNALADPVLGFDVHGLKELLDATFDAAPDGVAAALAAVQRIDMARKRDAANKRIAVAVTAATAAGASPIPFSDAALLVPIQAGMMAAIAITYDIAIDTALAASLAATGLATQAGRAVALNLIKLIPGGGSVVGGTISAGVAASFTYAMGRSWREICEGIATGRFGAQAALNSGDIKAAFLEEFKRQFSRVGKKENS
ncbi:MAG: GTPase [Actinomycetes bacterium]